MADDNEQKTAPKPWWAPDTQGFVIGAIVSYVGIALFYRMTHPAEINDKLLDMMLTILFGTAFVGIVNYLIGSSRGSDSKTETQNKIIDKLTPPPTGTGNGALEGDAMKAAVAAAAMAAPAAAAVAAPAAAAIAAPPAADIAAPPVVEAEVAEVVPREVEKQVAAAVAASKEVEKQK